MHPFYEATLCSEGNGNTLSDWFFTLDYVLKSTGESENDFQELANENPGSEEYVFLQTGAGAARLKVEDYYRKADDSAAYYAASVLHPGSKWSWFEGHWSDDPARRSWLEGGRGKRDTGVKGLVQELWEEEYKGKYGAAPAVIEPTARDPPQSKNPDDRFGGLHRHKRLRPQSKVSSDHYRAFITTDPEDEHVDALEFWNSRHKTQPDIARFALDMLAIPMMSAECERVFSSAKHLITDSRNRLNPDIIEASECLKHWLGKPDEKVDQELKSGASKEVPAVKEDENDTDNDDVVYEVDSDGEIMWKDD